MKVAILTKSTSKKAGGILDAILEPSQLICENFDVEIEVFGVRDELENRTLPKTKLIRTSNYKSIGLQSFGYSPEMKKALAVFKPDIIHVHGLFHYTSVLTFDYASKNKIKYLVTPHGMLDPWAMRNSRWKKIIANLVFERRHLKNASCIHSLCESETNSISELGFNSSICQIPNGINVPFEENKLIPPWSNTLDSNKKVMLYLGRIHPKKGLMSLIEAWKNIKKNDNRVSEEWVLVIAGWEQLNHQEQLLEITQKLGLENEIIFIGPQFNDNKTASYLNASCFILPSLSEGLPLVILEAWAHKLPVIMSSYCNIPEGFQRGAAIEINLENIYEGLMKFFMLSEKERHIMGQLGFDLINKKFTWDKISRDMYSVYKWILGQGPRPSCCNRGVSVYEG